MKTAEDVRFQTLEMLNMAIWFPCNCDLSPLENFLEIGPVNPEVIDEGIRLAMQQYSLIPEFQDANDWSRVEYVHDEQKPELTLITIEAGDSNFDVQKAESELGYGVLYVRNVRANSPLPDNFLYNLSRYHICGDTIISSKWLIVVGYSDNSYKL